MDPLSSLPPECFERILVALVNDHSCATLAALLQTNRYFATLTLPYLYKDPYRFAPYEEGARQPSNDTRLKDSLITGIPTFALLNFLPPSTVFPEVLSLATQTFDSSVTADFEDSSTTAAVAAAAIAMSGPPMFDYITQIRHLTPQPWTIGLRYFWKWTYLPPGISDFILTQEFHDLCRQANLLPTKEWSLLKIRTNDRFWWWCFQVLFRCEANWVLADPIMEQLQSLTIPFSDLGRYAEPATMCRMKRLDTAHFILEYFSETMVEEECVEELRGIVRFVKEHSRIFPGVLMSVSISRGESCPLHWFGPLDFIPQSILEEIAGILPELRRPISITTTNSVLQLIAHVEDTDVIRLEELDTVTSTLRIDEVENFNFHQNILPQCRSLRLLRTMLSGAGNFQWAVDEKRRLVEQGGQDNTLSRKGSGRLEEAKEAKNLQKSSSSQPHLWRKELVPMQDLTIFDFHAQDFTNEVNNAAFAFSQSLRNLEARTRGRENEAMPRFGEGWVDMPVLMRLVLYAEFRRSLVITPQLLSLCFNVISVHLCDVIKEYQCDDIEPYLSAYLPRLESLTLTGTPALSFNPITFHSTTQLTDLSVTVTNFLNEDEDEYDFDYESNYGDEFTASYCFIPPLDELYRSYGLQDNSAAPSIPPTIIRPNWTWDWDLPRLVSLKLSSEFAFLFQFRMLQGCPALQTLELEMRTLTAEPTRTITESDMVHPSSHKPIVLRALTKLRMHGSWKFSSPSFALQFLTSMFPNLECLSAIGWLEIPLQDMIQLVVRRMPRPVKELRMGARINYRPTQAEADLFWRGDSHQQLNQDEVLTTVIIRRNWYYLMREENEKIAVAEEGEGEREASHQ